MRISRLAAVVAILPDNCLPCRFLFERFFTFVVYVTDNTLPNISRLTHVYQSCKFSEDRGLAHSEMIGLIKKKEKEHELISQAINTLKRLKIVLQRIRAR